MAGRKASRRKRLGWVNYMQRDLAGLQKRVSDDRMQKGVE